MTATETAHKPRRKRFVWISAISIGTLFSAATFGLGTGSFDELTISLGLRSVISTQEEAVYRFGDTEVVSHIIYAENLPARGVPYRSVQIADIAGRNVRIEEEGAFKPDHGQAIGSGTFMQAWTGHPDLVRAPEVTFCNVTARYKYRLPVYHYTIGIAYASFNFKPLVPDAHLISPYLRHARKTALANGWDGTGQVMHGFTPPSRFIEDGITFRWDFCETRGF
jgi:hypothetical protein